MLTVDLLIRENRSRANDSPHPILLKYQMSCFDWEKVILDFSMMVVQVVCTQSFV